jgi:hypothetical protein
MGNRLDRFLQPDEGRLPRTCTPRLCEFVWLRPPPATAGVVPPPSKPPTIPGFRFRLVGTVHQIGPAPLPDFPSAVTSGFGLLRSDEVGRGGVLGWSVPLRELVDHPWNLDAALRSAASVRSDLGARLEQVDVGLSAAALRQARETSTAGGRRLLLVAGSLAAILLAYLLFVGVRLREDGTG